MLVALAALTWQALRAELLNASGQEHGQGLGFRVQGSGFKPLRTTCETLPELVRVMEIACGKLDNL